MQACTKSEQVVAIFSSRHRLASPLVQIVEIVFKKRRIHRIFHIILKNLNPIIIFMLVIILEPVEGNSVKIPPLLQPVSQQILNEPCCNLQSLAHSHFKDYLSPFIRKEHFQLTNFKQVLIPDYPYFIYFNSSEYISTILCTIRPYDSQKILQRSHLLKNSVVLVTKTNQSIKEEMIRKSEIQKINSKLSLEGSAFICGKQIKLNFDNEEEKSDREAPVVPVKRWSDLILEKQDKWQNENETIYVLRNERK